MTTSRQPQRYEGVDDDLVRRADDKTGLNKPVRYSRVLKRILRDDEDFPPNEPGLAKQEPASP